MRNETIAIHAGYDPDPTTKAVAVPIYQTASYAFDSADHGAALFNLEAEGFRYSRIANPTSAVLEKRIAELEGGVGALAVATGQAALHFSFVNLADGGGTERRALLFQRFTDFVDRVIALAQCHDQLARGALLGLSLWTPLPDREERQFIAAKGVTEHAEGAG